MIFADHLYMGSGLRIHMGVIGFFPPRMDKMTSHQEGRKSSFCEQKEAKKLHLFSWLKYGGLTAPAGGSRTLMDKVFLLLFVHKKKTFSLP